MKLISLLEPTLFVVLKSRWNLVKTMTMTPGKQYLHFIDNFFLF